MGLLDALTQLVAAGTAPDHQQFDQVAQSAPPGVLGSALAGAFRADSTPPIGDMVGQLFGHSNPQQRAGLINELLAAVGPAAASALIGGALSRVLPAGATQVTAEQANQLTPAEVGAMVNHAHVNNPGLAEQLGGFYAQHAGLIKTLGGAAMMFALAKMKDHLAQR